MKIYQLHKIGGEWEDRYDYIIGSYLKKERAEEEKLKAEQEDKELVERSQRCWNCPFLEENPCSLNDLLTEYPNYCSEAKLECGDFGINCENYFSLWHDESTFVIEEVEVEE